MEKSSRKWAGWIALTVIVLVAGVALAVANSLTEGPIAEKGEQLANQTVSALFPDADGFESVTTEGGESAYRAKQGDTVLGYAIVTSAQGYGGTVEVTTGVDAGGALRGIGVGGADFKETEGLGSKAREASFTDQFKQKTPPLALGDGVEAISGATVTSRAVVNAVNDGAQKLAPLMGGAAAQGAQSSGTRTASASVIGYAGPVLARLTLDADNKISALDFGAERMLESEGLGARVRDESFAAQFVGKQPPIALGDIDAISGATVTSQAAVDAVNEAYAFLVEKQ